MAMFGAEGISRCQESFGRIAYSSGLASLAGLSDRPGARHLGLH